LQRYDEEESFASIERKTRQQGNEMNHHIPHLPVLAITQFIRRMRGESQAQLVEGDDGRFYVAKFLGNPQGNRTLVNEVLASQLLDALDVETPPLCRLSLAETPGFEEHLYFAVEGKRVAILAGEHLGSLCPVDPNKVAIFDFLPARMFHRIANLQDFARMFVIDRWLNNLDHRQAIFLRDGGVTFKACFIDHGRCFGGQDWQFSDVATLALPTLHQIFERLDMTALTREVIERIEAIDANSIAKLSDRVPREWMSATDRESVVHLLGELDKRRSHLKFLVTMHLDRFQMAPKKRPSRESRGALASTQAS
jgi:hypothetical protein